MSLVSPKQIEKHPPNFKKEETNQTQNPPYRRCIFCTLGLFISVNSIAGTETGRDCFPYFAYREKRLQRETLKTKPRKRFQWPPGKHRAPLRRQSQLQRHLASDRRAPTAVKDDNRCSPIPLSYPAPSGFLLPSPLNKCIKIVRALQQRAVW